MNIRHLILLPLIVALFSCSNHRKDGIDRKPVSKIVHGEVMNVSDLQGYGIVCTYKGYLFLKERRDTSRLVVYKIEGDSLKYYKGLLDKGRGPGEFYYVEYALCGDTLFVSNSDPGGIRSIYGIPLDEMSSIDDRPKWKRYDFQELDIMTGLSFAPLANGLFVISGGKFNSKEILSQADFNTVSLNALDFWPDDHVRGPLHSKQMVYMQNNLCSKGNRIIYANLNARYMFIADIKDGEFIKIKELYSHLPQYEIKQDENIRYLADGEYGILLCSTATHIYAQVGRTVKEVKQGDNYKGYPNSYFDEIEVYDWDGRFIDNYQTDRPFLTFTVSEDNHFLYTFTEDIDTKEPLIMRYRLK